MLLAVLARTINISFGQVLDVPRRLTNAILQLGDIVDADTSKASDASAQTTASNATQSQTLQQPTVEGSLPLVVTNVTKQPTVEGSLVPPPPSSVVNNVTNVIQVSSQRFLPPQPSPIGFELQVLCFKSLFTMFAVLDIKFARCLPVCS